MCVCGKGGGKKPVYLKRVRLLPDMPVVTACPFGSGETFALPISVWFEGVVSR